MKKTSSLLVPIEQTIKIHLQIIHLHLPLPHLPSLPLLPANTTLLTLTLPSSSLSYKPLHRRSQTTSAKHKHSLTKLSTKQPKKYSTVYLKISKENNWRLLKQNEHYDFRILQNSIEHDQEEFSLKWTTNHRDNSPSTTKILHDYDKYNDRSSGNTSYSHTTTLGYSTQKTSTLQSSSNLRI